MKITPELLKKYAVGECTREEKQQVKNWLSENEDLSSRLPKEKLNDERSLVWKGISGNISNDREIKNIPIYTKIFKYAAAAIFLITVGISAYYFTKGSISSSAQQSGSLSEYKTVQTQRGEKRTIKLSDGSTIRMDYETEMRVPEKFEGSDRVVYLAGHAYFNVARDPERPFIIYTEDSKTQVLGTSFDINTSKKKGEIEIIVTSGKVAFSEKDQSGNLVTLTANERALLNPGKTIETSEVDAQKLTAWKENRLVFDDYTLKNIIEILEPWYDIEISVHNPKLLRTDFNLDMDNPSLEGLMNELSFLGDFSYSIEDKKVSIY